ncbi:uncharacterized protein LOC135372490 [Ornithodoros turicata]|uniref:uncharacterized protein LOC135372490 n=1 Tax=Ornithodoros turicata TaxID=34597 RepID=UPI0031388130
MKLCAVVFVLGTMLAVASAECPRDRGFAVALDCSYTLDNDPIHRAVADADEADLSDPSKVRAVCCYLKAVEKCLKDGLQGECSYAADELFQDWRDQLKVGDLSCADIC